MELDKEINELELKTLALIEKAFEGCPAVSSMSIVSQFINGFYLLRTFPRELKKDIENNLKGGYRN